MTAVRLTDSTLRDGSHSVAHRYTVEQVAAIAGRLAAAGVPVIEVAHGDGLGGSSFNYGFSLVDEHELIAAAVEAAPAATIATLLLPGIGLAAHLREAHALGARLVRVATHATEADIAAQHIAAGRELGLEVNGFLMMSHMSEPAALAEQARLMESYGAHGVYVVDSAGALVPAGARERVHALREALGSATKVGFHAHDNLGCGVGNTLAAIEAGAELVDASVGGMGAGAGNMATELFAAAAERSGVTTGLDVVALGAAADDVRALLGVAPRHDAASLAIGYAGVYSSFLLHADRAAERFGIPATEILVELGRRRVVGGQEDMILDVAAELAGGGDPMTVDVEALATRLHTAQADGVALDPPSDAEPFDEAVGYRVQAALRARHAAGGARPVGHKLGFTSRAKQVQMGVDEPIRGFLTDRMLRGAGTLSLAGLIQPRIEPEIAFRLGADLHGPQVGREAVLDATASVLAALEVLDSRYRDYRFTLPDVVADNTSAAGVVLGSLERPPRDVDLVAEAVWLRVGDDEPRRATGADVLGDPAAAVAWLARAVPLRAGDLVLSGGMTDAARLHPGVRVAATYSTLGTIAVEATA